MYITKERKATVNRYLCVLYMWLVHASTVWKTVLNYMLLLERDSERIYFCIQSCITSLIPQLGIIDLLYIIVYKYIYVMIL